MVEPGDELGGPCRIQPHNDSKVVHFDGLKKLLKQHNMRRVPIIKDWQSSVRDAVSCILMMSVRKDFGPAFGIRLDRSALRLNDASI